MPADVIEVDLAADYLQAVLHRVDEHLCEVDEHLRALETAAHSLRACRRELAALHSELVFGGDDA